MIKKIELTSDKLQIANDIYLKGDVYTVYLYTDESYDEIVKIQEDLGETTKPDAYGNPFQYLKANGENFVFSRVSEITVEEFSRVVSLMRYVGYIIDTNEFCQKIINFNSEE